MKELKCDYCPLVVKCKIETEAKKKMMAYSNKAHKARCRKCKSGDFRPIRKK